MLDFDIIIMVTVLVYHLAALLSPDKDFAGILKSKRSN